MKGSKIVLCAMVFLMSDKVLIISVLIYYKDKSTMHKVDRNGSVLGSKT